MPLARKPIGVDQAAQKILQFTQMAKAHWNWPLLFPKSIFLFKQPYSYDQSICAQSGSVQLHLS
jgi:hypothetical protein